MELQNVLACIFVLTVISSTTGQHVVDGNTLTEIMTELKSLKEAQNVLDKSSEIRDLKFRVLALENTVDGLLDTVKMLQNDNKELVSEIHQLQNEKLHTSVLKTDINQPKTDLNEEIDYKADLEVTTDLHGKENMEIKNHISKTMGKRAFTFSPTLPATSPPQPGNPVNIAFSAALSQSEVDLRQGDTIIFDKVFANIGSAYNSNTGVITAPTKGAYLVSLAMSIENGQKFYLVLTKEGVHLFDIYADSTTNNEFTSTTKEWIIDLNQGDRVWVRSGTNGQLHGNLHSMITGFLLFETNYIN